MLYTLFKNVAFTWDAEFAHEQSIKFLSRFPGIALQAFGHLDFDERLRVKTTMGDWPFPIGLAAGLDKNAECIEYFSRLGFGAVEVGTVTPVGQSGNDKPRLFRYPSEQSLRNRMGFNNEGAAAMLTRVRKRNPSKVLLGVNFGKNKVTPQEKAPEDYVSLYDTFATECDYLVINVSSPNTPGLRDLQQKDELKKILDALIDLRKQKPVPLFLKISPDLAREDVVGAVELALESGLEGLIATNTTRMPERGDGGVSGALMTEKAAQVRKWVMEVAAPHRDTFTVIGVGGISRIEHLEDFWRVGGKVAQVYTGFIYHGPELLLSMHRGIMEQLETRKCSTLEELIESYYREG